MTTKTKQPRARAWQLFGLEVHCWEPIPEDCRPMTMRAYCDATGEEYNAEADTGESVLLVRDYEDSRGVKRMESVGEAWGVEEDEVLP